MSSYCENIPLRWDREKRVPSWSPQQRRWATGFDPVQVRLERTKFAFDRRLRCGTEVSRRLAVHSRVPPMGPAAQPSPAVRSVKEQWVRSDRDLLLELAPGLELQERIPLSPQPGASYKLPRRVQAARLRRPETADKRIGLEKLVAPVECIGRPILCQRFGGETAPGNQVDLTPTKNGPQGLPQGPFKG